MQPGGTGRYFCGVKQSTLHNSLHYHWLHRGMVALFLGCHNSEITWGYSDKLCTSWNCMIIFPLEFLPLPAYKIGTRPELYKPNCFFSCFWVWLLPKYCFSIPLLLLHSFLLHPSAVSLFLLWSTLADGSKLVHTQNITALPPFQHQFPTASVKKLCHHAAH